MRCASGGGPALEPAIEHPAFEHNVHDKPPLIHGRGRHGPNKSYCVAAEDEERNESQESKDAKHAHEKSLHQVAGIMAQERDRMQPADFAEPR